MSPGNPAAINAMSKQIANTNDENDLETLRGTINGPMNAKLHGKGAIPLNAAIEDPKRKLTTVEGQQRRQDTDQIKRASDNCWRTGNCSALQQIRRVEWRADSAGVEG